MKWYHMFKYQRLKNTPNFSSSAVYMYEYTKCVCVCIQRKKELIFQDLYLKFYTRMCVCAWERVSDISLLDMNNRSSLQILLLFSMNCQDFFEKIMRGFLLPFLHALEFRIDFLLDWLTPKPREPNLPCYLIHSLTKRKNWISAFPKSISVKGKAAKLILSHQF